MPGLPSNSAFQVTGTKGMFTTSGFSDGVLFWTFDLSHIQVKVSVML
jgi:hypothetical protein